MSKAALARLGCFAAGAACLLAAFLWRPWTVEGTGLGVAAALIWAWCGARAYGRFAAPEQKRADLEDRLRNTP